MFPYLLIFLIASILFFTAPKKPNKLAYVFVLLFICIAGFRDMIGGFDVYVYAEVYEFYNGLSFFRFTPFEKGYLIYNMILKYVSGQREFMFFMTALFMTLLHYYSIKKHAGNIGLSLFIYFCKFFLFSFVYLRQGLAMGIAWLAISFILEKKFWKASFILLLAFFFHKTVIIFAPFLLIANKKFNRLQLGFLAALILFISLTPLGDMLVGFVGDVSDSRKLEIYANNSSGVNFFYLIEGGIGVYLAIMFQKYFYYSAKTTLIFNGFFMYSLTILAGLTNATFIRFSWYYFIFVVLALPYIYYYFRYEKFAFKPIFKNLLFIYYSLVFFRLLLVYDGGDFLPYKAFFQDFDRNGRWEFMEYRRN